MKRIVIALALMHLSIISFGETLTVVLEAGPDVWFSSHEIEYQFGTGSPNSFVGTYMGASISWCPQNTGFYLGGSLSTSLSFSGLFLYMSWDTDLSLLKFEESMSMGMRWEGRGRTMGPFIGGGPVLQQIFGFYDDPYFTFGVYLESGFQTNKSYGTGFNIRLKLKYLPLLQTGKTVVGIGSGSFGFSLEFGMAMKGKKDPVLPDCEF